MTLSLRRSQIRIPLIGAIASLLFLASLAVITRTIVRKVTMDDLDEELETLSVAIGSDLELQGIATVEHAALRAGVESNTLAFRLERHSAVLLHRGRVIATAGELARRASGPAVQALASRPEGTFTAVEPFSGQHWRCRFRVTHLSGAANGATLIVFRPVEPTLRTLDRLDFALALIVILGVAGSGAIIAYAVRRALRPVEEVTRIAAKAEASDLSHRVEVTASGEEVERLTAVINSLFDRLERAFESQRRLVSDAAHELKTPAAAILAEAQEALRSDTPEMQRQELLKSIASSARSMARESDDLLTLARGETLRSETRPVDLREIAVLAVAASQPLARERRMELRLEVEGMTVVEGDAAALERMVANLIANAVRYGLNASDVLIRVSGGESQIEITVADRGPGIPEADRKRIFERFVRLPDARRLRPEGSGLGLAIVAQAVRNHGGSIEVLAREGGGAVFVVTLPRRRPSALGARPPEIGVPRA